MRQTDRKNYQQFCSFYFQVLNYMKMDEEIEKFGQMTRFKLGLLSYENC